MKNTILIITTTILGVLVLMTVMTINGRMNRSMEVTSSLPSIVEETIENMTQNPKYSIHNTNEFAADLSENLAVTVDAVSNVRVDVLQCDKDRGILSVKVMLDYKHPNGNTGTIACERLAIFNKIEENEKNEYRVSFFIGSDLYKEYVVPEGAALPEPVTPILGEGVFIGWVNSSGGTADFTQPVLEDVVYFASIG